MITIDGLKKAYSDEWKSDEEDNGFWELYEYSPLLKLFAPGLILQIDDEDYQGDSRVLYQDSNRIGYLQFGWGSCSGCDALQSCCNWDEVLQLALELQGQIKWFDTKNAALDWFLTHDWEGDYSWQEKEQKEFVEKAIEILKEKG